MKKSNKFLFALGLIICTISILGLLMAGVGQLFVQILNYGAYYEFRIVPHWTLFGLFGLITFIPGSILVGGNL